MGGVISSVPFFSISVNHRFLKKFYRMYFHQLYAISTAYRSAKKL